MNWKISKFHYVSGDYEIKMIKRRRFALYYKGEVVSKYYKLKYAKSEIDRHIMKRKFFLLNGFCL